MTKRRNRLVCAAALGLAVILHGPTVSAHAPEAIEFNNVDIGGATCCRTFRLTDHAGRNRTLADYKGKVVVLTFGFTRCPDVCPTTMAWLNKSLAELGDDAKQVQVLFITLDPERDSRPVLKEYLGNFNPTFVGLRGSTSVTARTARDFRVFYKKAGEPKTYVIDHSLGSYIFDAEGKPRVFVSNGKTDLFLSDVRALLNKVTRKS